MTGTERVSQLDTLFPPKSKTEKQLPCNKNHSYCLKKLALDHMAAVPQATGFTVLAVFCESVGLHRMKIDKNLTDFLEILFRTLLFGEEFSGLSNRNSCFTE